MQILMIILKYWYYSIVKQNFKKYRFRWTALILLLIIIFIPSACRIRKEPDKLWNPRGKMMVLAKSLVGLPYKYGGQELYGFDCSGFVHYVFDCFGYTLPRAAKNQAKLKGKISLRQAKPGDILAFKLKGRWHTGIYAGDHLFIHAPNRNANVRLEKLNGYWKKRLKKVLRVIKD